MMGKKDYQQFADAVSELTNVVERENIICFLTGIFRRDNSRFNEDKFKEWIRRRIKKESMKGLNYNPKYMPLGVR